MKTDISGSAIAPAASILGKTYWKMVEFYAAHPRPGPQERDTDYLTASAGAAGEDDAALEEALREVRSTGPMGFVPLGGGSWPPRIGRTAFNRIRRCLGVLHLA